MFIEYIGAVTQQWLPLLIGAFGSLPWWLRFVFSKQMQNRLDGIFNPKALKIIGIICLFASFVYANYLAWVGQNIILVNNKKQIADLTNKINISKPQLNGNIEIVATGFAHEIGGAQCYLLLTLKNSGLPSVAEGFHLSIKNDKLNVKRIAPTFIPEGLKLRQNNRCVAEFHRNDALEEKALTPIQQGAVIRGWLRFDLPGVKLDDIKTENTIFTVDFMDYSGSQYISEGSSLFQVGAGSLSLPAIR